jgi:hypothetical protein
MSKNGAPKHENTKHSPQASKAKTQKHKTHALRVRLKHENTKRQNTGGGQINDIGDEGAIVIAEALKVNAVLTELKLWGSSIGPEGAIAIAEALKVNAVLTKLAIQVNNMGDAGKKAVRDAVKGRSGFLLEL